MSKLYKSWQQYPMSEWGWPNFSPQEVASKGEGELLIDPGSMDKLQALRTALGKPLLITSAYRSAAHNKRVGGATHSQHRLGKAFDIRMENQNPAAFEKAALEVGFTGFGHYPKSGFTHIDTGPARCWNDGNDFPTVVETRLCRPQHSRLSRSAKPSLTPSPSPKSWPAPDRYLPGAGAVSQGSGPVQIALAIVMVVIVCAFVAWLAVKTIHRPRDV